MGATRSASNSNLTPRPSHSAQAPCGLLKEKERGSNGATLMLQTGQSQWRLRRSSSPLVGATTRLPSPTRSAVSTESASRLRTASPSSPPWRITMRSMTISAVAGSVVALPSSSARSTTVASIRARTNPLRLNSPSWPRRSFSWPAASGANSRRRLPSGKASIVSTICCGVRARMGRPQLGQCGRPTRAKSRRRKS